MNLSAQTVVRAMRGESHSYLLGTSDSNFFVTKFSGGVGTERRLINEWVGSKLLSRIGLATPSVRIVEITDEFINGHHDKLSAHGLEPSSLRGLHFGSQFPGDPATSVVYDYLPDRFLAKVENLPDFIGTLLVDLWCGKASRRQAIFVKSPPTVGLFRALMIDNDEMLGGEAWRLEEAATPGLHLSLVPYAALAGVADLNPWLSKIESIPEQFFLSLASTVPEAWKKREDLPLTALLRQLSLRRSSLRSIALNCLRSNSKLFPRWVNCQAAQMVSAGRSSTVFSGAWQWHKSEHVKSLPPTGILAAAHLDGGRLSCSDEADLVSRLSKSATCATMAPNAVINKAKSIFPPKGPKIKGLATVAFRRIKASLQYDSMFDLQPAGVRCLPMGSGSKTLLFRAGAYSLDLQLEAEQPSQNWTVVGQLMNDDNPSEEMSNLPVRVMAGKTLVAESFTNEFGEFILPDLPQKRLHLCVQLTAEGVLIDVPLHHFQVTHDPERN